MLDECFEWRGSRISTGYGRKKVAGARFPTHRLAWAWANGHWTERGISIPTGMHVLHKCHNRACCNPQHLYLGTHQDNMRDKRLAARGASVTGIRHWKAKLAWEQVCSIRGSTKSTKDLSAEFGVSDGHIRGIKRGKYRRVA